MPFLGLVLACAVPFFAVGQPLAGLSDELSGGCLHEDETNSFVSKLCETVPAAQRSGEASRDTPEESPRELAKEFMFAHQDDYPVELNDLKLDYEHIFCGEVDTRDRASGYHVRIGGVDSPVARIGEVVFRNRKSGVYISKDIEIMDNDPLPLPSSPPIWRKKRAISSFFPDHCSISQVLVSILHASRTSPAHLCRINSREGGWSGPTDQVDSQGKPNNQVNDTNVSGGSKYCMGRNGSPFFVWFHRRRDGEIVTAFPEARSVPVSCRIP